MGADMHDFVDAMLDTTATATQAMRNLAGRPFSASAYIAEHQRLDDIATGKVREPIRVTAHIGYVGRHRKA
jgi:hypothetical protein